MTLADLKKASDERLAAAHAHSHEQTLEAGYQQALADVVCALKDMDDAGFDFYYDLRLYLEDMS